MKRNGLAINHMYEYDDVLIKPRVSGVNSRNDVDISVTLSNNVKIEFPLIASPMVGVVDYQFAIKLSKLGGLAILHRFYQDFEAHVDEIESCGLYNHTYGVSIPLNMKEDEYKQLLDLNPTVILIDVANGYLQSVREKCEEVKSAIQKKLLNTQLMAGNVVTGAGVSALINSGVDMVRVGIGNGSNCSTRNVTGIGIPTLSAISICAESCQNAVLVADGGIRNSGDFVKSIVAGATMGMSGRLFAETYESPNKGTLYGMASRTHQKNMHYEIKSVEGFDTKIEKKHSLEQFVREFGYGICSAGTYLNATNLNEMFANGEFVEASKSSIKSL